MKITKPFLPLILLSILITACGARGPETVPPAVSVPATEGAPTSTPETEVVPSEVPTADAEPLQSEQEALLSAFSQPVTAKGELLVLYGHLLDASGAPLAGHAVEIWQVDADGIYDHPGDSNTADRDMGFQFFGTAVTDENGLFAFRTILPGLYEPRPRHIHYKVKVDGATLLTSQFYFAEDVTAAQLGVGGEMLLLDLTDGQDGGGNAVKLAFKDIVVDTGAGGGLTLTPSQVEGPYYPVVDVSRYDHDLASIP
jgi:protocatechuate 3,4-dioxygenase beta subunit